MRTCLLHIDERKFDFQWICWGNSAHIHVALLAATIGDGYIPMDNARLHKGRIGNVFFGAASIERMVWPANSPNLISTEHLWDRLNHTHGFTTAAGNSPRQLH